MTPNFKLYFNGKLPQSAISKPSVPSNNGISESEKKKNEVLQQLYLNWLSGRPAPQESFRQHFVRTILIGSSQGEKNPCRHYFIWQFIERFSLDDIAIITGKNSLLIGKELCACFLQAEKHYNEMFGSQPPTSCEEDKFLLLCNWFNSLLNQQQEKEFVKEISLSEPMQYCFEIYLELLYGQIDEEILNQLQYGSIGKPVGAGDFIRQVKEIIENKGNSNLQ